MEKFTPIFVSDEVNVEFLKNSANGKPTCRINGKVAFIDRLYKHFVAPGSSWMVRIKEIHPRFIYIYPIIETHTAKENLEAFHAKIAEMALLKGSTKGNKQFKTSMLL